MCFSRLVLALFVFFFSPLVWAVELTPGQEYQGPQTLTVGALGISFALPEGWVGGAPQGQEFFVMAKPGLDGFILLSASEASEAELMTAMAAPLTLDEGVTLVPSGKPAKTKERITSSYTVSGTEYKGYGIAVVGGHKMSFYAIAVAGPKDLATVKKTAEAVVAGVKFKKPVEEKIAAQPAAKGGEWGIPSEKALICAQMAEFFEVLMPAVLRSLEQAAFTEIEPAVGPSQGTRSMQSWMETPTPSICPGRRRCST